MKIHVKDRMKSTLKNDSRMVYNILKLSRKNYLNNSASSMKIHKENLLKNVYLIIEIFFKIL